MRNKIIGILLVACLGVLFAACSGGSNEQAAGEPGLYSNGQKVEVETVLNIGDYEIGFDEYRANFLNSLSELESAGTAIGDDEESLELVTERALSYLKNQYAILELAKKEGVELTEEELTVIDNQISATKTSLGEEEFLAQLEALNYTEQIFEDISINYTLQNKLFLELYKDELLSDVKETYVRASHILIPFVDLTSTTQTEPTQDDKDKAKAEAEEVLEKVNAGEDFDELVTEYNQDPGMTATLSDDDYYHGYYFTTGTMVAEFEDATNALKEGETSDLVETSYGYHIIKRLPMEDEYLETFITTQDVIFASAQYSDFINDITEAADDFEVEYSEEYYLINTTSIQ